MERIYVRTFGEFAIQMGDTVVSDRGKRAHKAWMVLAYLLMHRKQVVSRKKLIELLWGMDSNSSNPENVLRITIHRARSILDGLYAGAGHELIQQKDGGYDWNADVEIEMDCERFEALCQDVDSSEEDRLNGWTEALSLYKGEFLPGQNTEVWVISVATHFHNLFLAVAQEAAVMLSERDRNEEAVEICRAAIASEPYHEPLHQILIKTLAAMKKQTEATEVYNNLTVRLFDDFGITPSEETREIYRTFVHSPEDRALPMDEIIDQLQEPEKLPGAMQCDYDYFKVLCYAERRTMERSGHATHIALFSVNSATDKALTSRTVNRVMDQLGEQLRNNLRRGDTIARCTVSQYVVMLPKANYENSGMVCRRILSAFHRAHPNVKAKIIYMVQPLTATFSINNT